MLKEKRSIRGKLTVLAQILTVALPVLCAILLLTQVAFAKNTYLINDGDYVFIHTTFATDPKDVLDEAGLELGEDDTYTTQNGVGLSEITIQRQQTVDIVYGTETMRVVTYGETVEQLLQRMGLLINSQSAISQPLSAKTYDGMRITITHNHTVAESYTVTTAFETIYCFDASLPSGSQVTLSEGCNGQIQYTDSVQYVNGSEASRTNVSVTVLSEPATEVIAIGAGVELPEYVQYADLEEVEEILKEEIVPEETEAPEQIVAESEDIGGELVIGDGYIITEDGEVLTFTDTMQVVATAYHSSDEGCDNITATGTTVRVGVVAVDPTMIPYGTRMFIVTNDGVYIYGIGVAEDCGGSIKGNRIDLYFDTSAECWTFGIREATIYFLG